jgi:hypothetical protein
MNHHRNRSRTNSAEGNPAVFFVARFISPRQGIGIIKDKNCGLKANIMLEQVLPILVFVPFETHICPNTQ